MEVIEDTAKDFGVSIGEKIFHFYLVRRKSFRCNICYGKS